MNERIAIAVVAISKKRPAKGTLDNRCYVNNDRQRAAQRAVQLHVQPQELAAAAQRQVGLGAAPGAVDPASIPR